MSKGRLEAFSDGVIAIIITIMVLELKAPHHDSLHDLFPLWPKFFSYALSFLYVGIYWNNHHHLLHAAARISGMTLWANLNLLFWLSLIPFTTDWMGETRFALWPVVCYGSVLLLCAIAWIILDNVLLSAQHSGSTLQQAVGDKNKEVRSIVGYALAIGTAFIHPLIGCALYLALAMIWFIPDRRIERVVTEK